MATLILQRSRRTIGTWRKMKIWINRHDVVTLKYGEEKSLELVPGDYVLVAQMDWCKSEPLPLKLAEGETVTVLADGVHLLLAVIGCYLPFIRIFTLKEMSRNGIA